MEKTEELKLTNPKIRYKKFTHKIIRHDAEGTEKCDGKVYWDEGLEGYVCTKCDLYTGIK